MKVLGFTCGRKNGNTDLMMMELFKGVQEIAPDAECGFINLQEAEIIACTGCESCQRHHFSGDKEFRCIHKKEADHFYFIEQQVRAADAIIISAPAYNLMPPGIMIRFLNKLHASGDFREWIAKNTKVGAVFSIGGTDWVNLTQPILKMMCMEFVGSFDSVIDAHHTSWVNASGAILLEDEAMKRIHQMGINVAEAVIAKQEGRSIEYHGDPGICPDCKSRLMEVREDGCYCPICETRMDVSVTDGKVSATVTEESRAKNRWSAWGREYHDNNIKRGHKKADDGKAVIAERRVPFRDLNYKITLPEIQKD